MNRRHWLLAAAAPLLLPGCGFALRQPPDYQFSSIWLDLPASAFKTELQRQIEGSGRVSVLTNRRDRERADVILHSAGPQREQTVVSMTSAGEVREIQLRMSLRFSVTTPSGRELLAPAEIERQMDQSYSESESLSKGQEQALLYSTMQSDIVQQIVRRLEMVRL
ncbi:MAG: LPS assembly lipoprotein LptE [Ottowia sp.]|nr:LPS assembly lipoprotein LptE [Ottowia sp.]